MKELSLEKMEMVNGGCDEIIAGGVLALGGLGVAMVFLGPVGWAGALIAGAGGTIISAMC